MESCWEALPIGGRLVAAAYREESEAVLQAWYARVGGDLVRVAVEHAEKAGDGPGLDRPPRSVTIWSVNRW